MPILERSIQILRNLQSDEAKEELNREIYGTKASNESKPEYYIGLTFRT